MSKMGNFLANIKGQLTLNDIIPFSQLQDEEFKEQVKSKGIYNLIPSDEEVKEVCEFLECFPDDLYITPNMIYPICYFHNYNYIDLNSIDIRTLEFMDIKKRIEYGNKVVSDCINQKNFEKLFVFLDEKISFFAYEKLFEQIPDESKYSIFINIYSIAEYGFSLLQRDFIEKVVQYRPESVKEELIEHLSIYKDEEGYIEIFRGEGSKSTPHTQALSWTINKSVAIFFATRYNSSSAIYKGKVHFDNIIDYLVNRNEDEIIVFPENIINIQELKMYQTDKILKELEDNKYIKRFAQYNSLLTDDLFKHPDSIHGVLHCRRVLLHVLTLSYLFKLSLQDELTLILCAVYHDIGRENDDEDIYHGFQSFKKVRKHNLINLMGEQLALVKYIIENHCISDDTAIKNVKKYHITNKEHAVELLKIFKDADGLDRVRLGDLNPKYLRHDISQGLINYAYDLLKNIE